MEGYYIEKATDVNLALDLALDAQKGDYDKAFLVSNDGDFSGAVSSAIGFKKKIVYVAIGNNKAISHHLERVASSTFRIKKEFIEDCKLEEKWYLSGDNSSIKKPPKHTSPVVFGEK